MDTLPLHALTPQERKKAYNRAYYLSRREEIRQQQKAYRAEHSEGINARQSAWRASHRGYNQEQARFYRQTNGDQISMRRRVRYQINPEPARQQAKAYNMTHVEHVRARRKAHRQQNFNRYKVRDAAYYQANKHDRVRIWNKTIHARRRARKTQAGGSFTVREWLLLKSQYENTCLCCGRKEPDIKLTADHIVPIVRFGSSNIDNIQPLCGSCNSRKHDKVIDYRVRWQK